MSRLEHAAVGPKSAASQEASVTTKADVTTA